MILYLYPGACSLATHIALIEAELPYQLVTMNREKHTSDGRNYLDINPRGFIPALQLDNGEVLTESVAILAYLGHLKPSLLAGSDMTRWRALEALSFLATEIHGKLGPFFKQRPESELDAARQALVKHYDSLDQQLGNKPFLLGEQLTVADPYLFWALRAAPKAGIELPARLQAYRERMVQRPSVQQALKEEGLDA